MTNTVGSWIHRETLRRRVSQFLAEGQDIELKSQRSHGAKHRFVRQDVDVFLVIRRFRVYPVRPRTINPHTQSLVSEMVGVTSPIESISWCSAMPRQVSGSANCLAPGFLRLDFICSAKTNMLRLATCRRLL